jgi:AAA+ superfamily predicted ATPase
MPNLCQCIRANRPLLFIACESDFEVLTYLNDNFKNNFQVFSPTISHFEKLSELLKNKFIIQQGSKRMSLMVALETIHGRKFEEVNNVFDTYLFLDQPLDKQAVRKVKDIVTRHQMDLDFTVNMIFISQTAVVPPELERYSEVVFFDLPDEDALRKKSNEMASKDRLDLSGDNAPNEELIVNLKGLTLFEVEQAYTQSWKIFDGRVDLNFIREFKKGAIAKTELLSLLESNISFEDIGGLSVIKNWIEKSTGGWTVEGKKFGLPLKKGLLMVGVPGCGKSLTAKAIGKKYNLPVISFDPSRIFSSMVGESEHNMTRILKIIENVSPCVLFIDEIEKAFAGSHSSTFSDAGVTARVIGKFLIWFQDCTAPVFTVATSNNIQYLPPELVSRFDEVFFVNIPQDFEREDIFRIHIKKLGRDPDKFDLMKLAEKSKDLSGREIEQVLKDAMYEAFHSHRDIDTETILGCLAKKTSLILTMAEQLQFLINWVGWDNEKNDGIRARFASLPDPINFNRVKNEIEAIIKDVEKKKPFDDFDTK